MTDVVKRLGKVDTAEFDRVSTAVGAEVTARILSRRLAIHVLGEAAEAGQIQATLAQFGFNTVAKDLADAAIVIVLGEAALVTHGAALAARANSRRAFVSFTPRFLAPDSPGGQVFAALSERSLATFANSPATVAMHVMTMATLLSPAPDLTTSTPTPK